MCPEWTYKALTKKFPKLNDVLLGYLKSDSNIYPSVEHNIIRVLTNTLKDDIELMFDLLLDYETELDWFSKCIITSSIIKNKKQKEILSSWSHELIEFRKLVQKSIKKQNSYERRYTIHFFASFNHPKLNIFLEKYYKEAKDVQFLKHIGAI